MADNGFQLVRSQSIPALNLEVEEYSHFLGLSHFHLAHASSENVFMVAFRTLPEDSTGVAHILEHTVLCGSEKFPVRDPFFSMIRRSLNTFMNAFTTSDYTAYPFASQNRKDYFNLMEVYLDAVFFPRLDPLDFAQEGHRLAFETGDAESPLQYKGVVFNEMKGDASSPTSMLYHAIQEKLYPSTTYHYNSGGDPRHIPELSFDGLMQFYRTHYHPANAIFMTFGNMTAAEQQQAMHEFALSRLQSSDFEPIRVSREQRYATPVQHEASYPVDEEVTEGKTHIVISWLLGDNTDLEMLLKCHLLSDVLLDTSASPLRLALETYEHASGVSPMSGFEEDHHEMNFMCGVEGSDPQFADDVEALVLSVLEKVASEGIEEEKLAAVLHQLELSQREVGGDGAPYGLQLIFSCMSAAVHGGDPIGLLNLDPVLNQLRQDIRDPGFIRHLVKELLIDNPHRVRTVMKPDRHLGEAMIRQEQAQLSQICSALTKAERQSIMETAEQLAQRQEMTEDLSVLPAVGLRDIPARRGFPVIPEASAVGNVPATLCVTGTNGLVYQQVVSDLPPLERQRLELLPVFSQVVTETGSAGRGYLVTQHLQHSRTGGISAYASFRADAQDCSQFKSFFTYSSRTLAASAGDMSALLKETALAPDFDEPDRIRDLVQQLGIRRINSIAGNGHQYAMSAAAAQLRPVPALTDDLTGVTGIMRLKKLADGLDDRPFLLAFCEALSALQAELRASAMRLLIIADESHVDEAMTAAASAFGTLENAEQSGSRTVPLEPVRQDSAFVVTTQVNYCAAAFPTVPESHADAAALTVLGAVLRNNYLHTELREKGGAYGGGAGHDSTNGVFRFYSYRDPGLAKTYETFERAIDWVQHSPLSDVMIEEAVLGVIGNIDAPGSPSGEIRQAYHHDLFGRSAAYREERRAAFLDVRQQDLRRVAATYLTGRPARALVTSENRLEEIDEEFDTIRVSNTQD